jgi:hypothetical protein
MKKLLIATGIMLSLNASASQDWSWFPAATSQMSGFTQSKENDDKTISTRSVAVAISAWVDTGGRYDCTEWFPNAADMPGGASFSQTRDCQKHSFREFIYSAGGQNLHKRVEWKKEGMTDDRTSNGGEMDFIINSTTSTTGWLTDSAASNCTSWTPDVASIGNGKSFVQTRACDIVEKNTTVIYDYWKSGQITIQSEDVQTRNSTTNETQSATGASGDPSWIYDRTEYSSWEQDNGAQSVSCGGFVYPEDKVSDFVSSRTCDEAQVRQVYDVFVNRDSWDVGFEDPNDCPKCNYGPIEKRVVMEPEYRAHAVVDTLNVDVVTESWVDIDAEYDCSSWTPDFLGMTSSLTQTKSCKQNQERRRYYQIVSYDYDGDFDDDRYGGKPIPSYTVVYNTKDSQVSNKTQTRSIYVQATTSYKYESVNMTSSEARAVCVSSSGGREVLSSSGGTYNTRFSKGDYGYFLAYNYYSGYVNNVGNHSKDWEYHSKSVLAYPSCTFKRLIDDCSTKFSEICE